MKKLVTLLVIALSICITSNAQFKLLKKKNTEKEQTEAADSSKVNNEEAKIADVPKKEEKKNILDKVKEKFKKGKGEKEEEKDETESVLPEGSLTFEEFKNAYKPFGIRSHPRTIITSDIAYPETIANEIRKAIQKNDSNYVLQNMGNGKREKCMESVKFLKKAEVIAAFNMLSKDWAIELAWYTNEKIYGYLVANVATIRNFRK